MKIWISILLFEISAGVNAIAVFRVFERPIAGLIAGGVFNLVGAVLIWAFLKWGRWFRNTGLSIATIYTFGFAFPLWFSRLRLPLDQEVTTVYGIPIEIFHEASELFYLVLVLLTIMQIKSYLKKTPGQNNERV